MAKLDPLPVWTHCAIGVWDLAGVGELMVIFVQDEFEKLHVSCRKDDALTPLVRRIPAEGSYAMLASARTEGLAPAAKLN
jgi:hypothetical protein